MAIMKYSLLWLLLLVSLPLAAENVDISEELNSVQQSLRDIDAACAANSAKYNSNLSLAETEKTVKEKMEKGNFYFGRGDYITSSNIFYSIFVSYEKKDQIWDEAVYKLAESLFRAGNFVSATRYFEMLIPATTNSNYKHESLKGLIMSAYLLGRYELVKGYYNKFLEIGFDAGNDPELLYFMGKSLYIDGHYADSSKVLDMVPETSRFYPQARYLLGANAIKLGNLDEAVAFFDGNVNLTDPDKKYYQFSKVHDLSIIAAARVLLEKNDIEQSIQYYIMVDKNSPYFADSFFELGWAYTKNEQYDRAIETLRLIKYLAPNSLLSMKAEALEGSLLIKMRKYGDAMVHFNTVINKYTEIQKELSPSKNSSTFVKNSTSGAVADSLLPYSPIIQSLLKDNRNFSASIKLNEQIVELEKEIYEINILDEKINSFLNNENIASVYSPLKAGFDSALFLSNRISALKNKLMDLRKTLAWKDLNEEQRKEFEELEVQRQSMVEELEFIQTNPNHASDEEPSAVIGKFVALEGELVRAQMQTKALTEELEAIISMNVAIKKIPEKYSQKFFSRVHEERDEIKEISDALAESRTEISNMKNKLLVGGALVERELELHVALGEIIDKQNALLGDNGSRADYARISDLLRQAKMIETKLSEFSAYLNNVGRDVVAQVRVAHEKERANLESYKSELLVMKKEIEEIAIITMNSDFSLIKSTFEDVMLEANLGLIDVAWEKKDESSDEIMSLRTQRAQEIQQLYLNADGD